MSVSESQWMAGSMEGSLEDYAAGLARGAFEAWRRHLDALPAARDSAVRDLAGLLESRSAEILEANAVDIERAPEFGLSSAQVDRLRLNPKRLGEMATACREIADLPNPIGQILDAKVRPNGLLVQKVRVPLGVLFFIYESRPNVTTDAAALAIKSGNAILLRGGKEAIHSNRVLAGLARKALAQAGLASDLVSFVDRTERELVGQLLRLEEYIALAIPRGGESLIRRVVADARMPVLKHYKGICHVYLDASADLDMATRIIENSKCQRPSVCNAAECLLVHREAADRLLLPIAKHLLERGVQLRGCEETCARVPGVQAAEDADYATEYGDLILSVRVVSDLDEAIAHISQFGSGHTESIVTQDYETAMRFVRRVDSSAVLVNASTRFNDGGQFGLGAEIGISTDKFHARGPCGLGELTTYKYVALGQGQIRE